MLNTILLALIAALLVAVLVVFIRKNQLMEVGISHIRQLIIDSAQKLFEDELKNIATAYAEERKLIQWIGEMAEKGNVNVTRLAEGVEQRAYALAIKKAEDNFTLAQTTLADLRRKIADENSKLLSNIGKGYLVSAEENKKALIALQKQEAHAVQREIQARHELYNLTSMATDPASKNTRK